MGLVFGLGSAEGGTGQQGAGSVLFTIWYDSFYTIHFYKFPDLSSLPLATIPGTTLLPPVFVVVFLQSLPPLVFLLWGWHLRIWKMLWRVRMSNTVCQAFYDTFSVQFENFYSMSQLWQNNVIIIGNAMQCRWADKACYKKSKKSSLTPYPDKFCFKRCCLQFEFVFNYRSTTISVLFYLKLSSYRLEWEI